MDTVYTYPKKRAFEDITTIRNRQDALVPLVDADTTLRDFYYHYKPQPEVVKELKNRYENLEEMPDSSALQYQGQYVYEIKFLNKGGLVSPIIIMFTYEDGTVETERIGAYIWRKNLLKI
jgi:hypothetical protein